MISAGQPITTSRNHEVSAVPQGYKRSDAGLIPQDWRVSTIGAEFVVQLGKMVDAAKNSGIPKPYLGNRSVQWGRIDVEDIDTVPMTRSDLQRFRLRQGDLLVCEGGEIGRAAIWDDPIPECYYQKALHRLRSKGGYDVYLMMALLELWASTGYLANYVTQTSIAHLSKDKLEIVPVPVPSRHEQRAIAEALSDMDRLVEALDTLIAKKRGIKQAAMQQILAGKTRLTGFAGRWKTRTMEEIAEIDPENLSDRTNPEFGFNYISLEQVDEGKLHGWTEEVFRIAPSRARRVVRRGDVLMSTVRPNLMAHLHFRGQVNNAVCSTGFAVIRSRHNISDERFILAHLFSRGVRRQIDRLLAGSNYPAISSGDVRRIEIPCPPGIIEQRAVASVLSDMDAELAALELRRQKTRAIKRGMMQQLLTGRIRLVEPESMAKEAEAL